MKQYARYYPSEAMTLHLCADLTRADETILAAWTEAGERPADQEWIITPFQTADARHRINNAFSLVRRGRVER